MSRCRRRPTARADGTLVGSLQFSTVNPQPGRWRVAVAVFGPMSGTALETPFTGKISLDPAEGDGGRRAELAVDAT